MEPQAVYELVGYAGSALVALSLTMRSILRLRVINLAGAAAFAVYGVLIGALPVAAVNVFIIGINLYYLRGMLRAREYFEVLEVSPGSAYLARFLEFWRHEVDRFFPGFARGAPERELAVFVLRDMVPAGLVIAEPGGPGVLRLRLDFVVPQYRDFGVAECLFSGRHEFFRARGIHEVRSAPGTRAHAAYLRRMGFAPVDPAQPAGDYALRLPAG